MKTLLRAIGAVAIVFVAVSYGCQGLMSLGAYQIAQTAQGIAEKYPDSMSVEDFQLDAKAHIGQGAKVRGVILCFNGDSCFLYQSPDKATQNMIVDISQLSRGTRQTLLQCSDIMFHPCWYVVGGVVENEFAPMLQATAAIQAN